MNAPRANASTSNKLFLLFMLGLAAVSALAAFSGVITTIVSALFLTIEDIALAELPVPFTHYRIAGAVGILFGLLGCIGAFGVFKRAKWGLQLGRLTTAILWLNGAAFGAHILVRQPQIDAPSVLRVEMVTMGVLTIVVVTVICGGLAWLSLKEEVISEFGG
jgi:uncharacterized membrane protein (DUF2068 family)